MTGGSTIVEFWRGGDDAQDAQTQSDDILLLENAVFDAEEDAAARLKAESRAKRARIALALVAIGWIGFAAWAAIASGIMKATPAAWMSIVASMSVPLVLLGTVYLLFMRGGRAETRRYLDTAHALRLETQMLEMRLGRITAQLENARQTMQDQAELLDSYGAAASSNMEASAELIAGRARQTAEKAEAAEKATSNLVARMDTLVAGIPALEDRASQIAGQIMDNSHALSERIDTMEARLHTLAELSDDARARTLAATKSLSAQLTQLQETTRTATEEVTGMADIAASRIDATAQGARRAMEASRDDLEAQADALSALIESAESRLGETSKTMLSLWSRDLGASEADLSARMDGAIGRMRDLLATTDRDISARATALETLVSAAKAGIGAAGEESLAMLRRDLTAAESDLSGRIDNILHIVRQVMTEVEDSLSNRTATLESLMAAARTGIDSSSEKALVVLSRDMERIELDLRTRLDSALGRVAGMLKATDDSLANHTAALDSLIGRSQDRLDAIGNDTVIGLSDAIGDVESRLHQINQLIEGQRTLVSGLQGSLDDAVSSSEGRFVRMEQEALGRTERLTDALRQLAQETQRIDAALTSGGVTAEKLIGCAETLMVALDSSVRELDESYPAALDRFDDRMERSRALLTSATPELERLEAISEALAGRAEESESLLRNQGSRLTEWLESTQGGLEANRALVDRLRVALDGAHEDATRITEGAGPLLVTTLLRVKDTADQAAERARQALGRAITEAAQKLGEESEKALQDAVSEKIAAQIAELAHVAEDAVKSAHLASERLTRQLLTIADTSASVEKRIEEAERTAENRDRDHFARRSALLIESLNSTAIDVAKILSNDVTDSAWSAYLKGDRGVFTRRAVKLLDAGESREIALHYDRDTDFRDHVNRYIHDFESMLRIILSARDGNALGVAMLSSDMGKLYVALAQAIERLRQ